MLRMAVLLQLTIAASAGADTGRARDELFPITDGGPYALEGGLVVTSPAALDTGISTGGAVGLTRRCGCVLAYGARASWSTASVSSTTWTVAHSEVRLRAIGGARYRAGRGTLWLRVGMGPSVVRETRERNQGMRAGLTGDALRTVAWRAVPAMDVEAVVTLQIHGSWLAVLGGGPSIHVLPGDARAGFTTQLGVAWQP